MTALALKLPDWPFAATLRRHGPASILLAAMVALFAFAVLNLVLHGSGPGFNSPASRAAQGPAVERLRAQAVQMSATQLRQVAPEDALAINAAIPVSNAANPAARPFLLAAASEADRARSLDCLTAAIYYEAATEPTDGQRAVAQVVLNRVRHPAYPSTVCGVVFEGARRITGCQFSFSCDGSLRRAPMADYWQRARHVAEAALSGYVYAPVGWATHYHANYVVPYWASSLVKSANVGAHIFYRWRGGWGRPPAFNSRYAGVEPNIQWRGGFGQPTAAERLAAAEAAAAAGERDAAAADAAEGAPPIGSVDSFQRAVLRRYEPLRRDTANAVIAERTRADRTMSNSQRWALTGRDSDAQAPQQRPLGRWGTVPADTPAAPAPPPPPAANPSSASATPPASTAPSAQASR
ncbi:MAG TPA: cell wall hydrolase [Allosphingosinicella sp.]|jgi:spore germination cell wall hydrolase CwlJ-like protein|nr:cell wall hydrolase [Allosphingosinicella sp.]